MAVDHRICDAPDQNLTCVKCALQDGRTSEIEHIRLQHRSMPMATISTPEYLLDQAKRRLIPTLNNMPGMGVIEKRLRGREWKQFALAEPPPGSDLKPVMGDAGLPVVGHMIEMFRGGPEYVL